MTWVRLDDKRALNAKLLQVGFEGRGLDEAAICWSAHEETDGFINDKNVVLLCQFHGLTDHRKRARLVRSLVVAGRWTRDDNLGGWWINDFLEYNPSHADLELRRQRDRERKKPSGKIPSGIQAESKRNPSGSNSDSKHPVPTRPDPKDSCDPPAADAGAVEQKTRKPRQPDLLFEALAEECGLDLAHLTPSARGNLNRALKDIKPTDVETIRLVCKRYRAKWPIADVTPSAIAKHWPKFINASDQTSWEAPAIDRSIWSNFDD